MPGMWFELERIFAEEGITIGYLESFPPSTEGCPLIVAKDKSASYYVGDAAGRANDFASTDRKFALNVGVQFYTPEVSSLPAHALVTTSSLVTGILPQDTSSATYAPRIPCFLASRM
jgi:hypothetical protein